MTQIHSLPGQDEHLIPGVCVRCGVVVHPHKTPLNVALRRLPLLLIPPLLPRWSTPPLQPPPHRDRTPMVPHRYRVKEPIAVCTPHRRRLPTQLRKELFNRLKCTAESDLDWSIRYKSNTSTETFCGTDTRARGGGRSRSRRV